MSTFGRQRAEVFDRAAKSQYYRDNVAGLTAFERHTKLIQDALSYNNSHGTGADSDTAGAADSAAVLAGTRTDADVLKERYRFIRSAEDDVGDAWEVRLARKYYARLFKEYAIADLSRYKQGAIGLRWRTHAEVVSGKGQFICGGRGCEERRALASFEVPFAYKEAGQAKQALVKLRLCPRCAGKLNYKRGSSGGGVRGQGEEEKGNRGSRDKDRSGKEEQQDKSSRGGKGSGREKSSRGRGERRQDGSEGESEDSGREDGSGPQRCKRRRRSRERIEEEEGVPSDGSRERQQQHKGHSQRRLSSERDGRGQRMDEGRRSSRHSRRERDGSAEDARAIREQPHAATAEAAEAAGLSMHSRHGRSSAVDHQQQQQGSQVKDGSAPATKDGDEVEFERMLESMFAQI